MALIESYILNHLGLTIEELDCGGAGLVPDSIAGMKEVGKRIADYKPDTIILTTPHNIRYSDYVHISPGEGGDGIMRGPWIPGFPVHINYDTEFVSALVKAANENGIPAGTDYEVTPKLDHGTTSPLKFVNDHYTDYKVVRICVAGISFADHYRLGMIIRDVCEKLNRKAVFIGSADLSHRLKAESPYGLAQEGLIFEDKIDKTLRDTNFIDFMTYDLEFLEEAAECGLRSCIVAAGTLDGMDVEHKVLAHEHTYGVGCPVAWYKPTVPNPKRKFLEGNTGIKELNAKALPDGIDPYVYYAEYSLKNYVKTGKFAKTLRFLPAKMVCSKHGVFIEVYKDGELRSFYGLDTCKHENTAVEIFQNAVNAADRCPVATPITEDELEDISVKVFIIKDSKLVEDIDAVDFSIQGLTVVDGFKRRFVMPGTADAAKVKSSLTAQNIDLGKAKFYALDIDVHK